jgi:hypothetical protein
MSANDFAAVPLALRERAQWLCWRLEEKPGAKKPAKMPYYASGKRRTGVQGSAEDRAALVTFDAAVAAMADRKFSGIGFAFLPDDGLIGIDLDKMVDAESGEISPRAQRIIESCQSYTEWSPSGNGFHIYVFGTTETAKDNGIGVEMFCGRQFFTVTGRHLAGSPTDVAPIAPAVLRRLHKTIAEARSGGVGGFSDQPDQAPAVPPAPTSEAPPSDLDKLRSALDALDPGCGYDDWIRIGMALRSELGEGGFALWDAWSNRSERYPGTSVLQSHWKSFTRDAVKAGTLFRMAKSAGWKPPRAPQLPSRRHPQRDSFNRAPDDESQFDRDPTFESPSLESPAPSEAAPSTAQGGEGESAPGASGKKNKKPVDWERYYDLLDNFVLIYGTDTIYDLKARLLLKVNHLRLAFGSDYVKMWLGTDRRKMIRADQLVFDPTGRCEPPAINLFAGLELAPVAGDYAPIMELLYHLCEDSAESEQGVEAVMDWVLKWLALPLQRIGTKMRSALVFHGPQGAGKNLFFEIIAAIYGRYAIVVGQDQLESQFNDWASRRLFLIGDEVVARQELYHQKNKLKAFITGETIQINTKMMPLRTEANHVNVVFLSNEPHPLALEEGDRRYLVVYTPPRRHDDLYRRVAACLARGGAAAFHQHLRTLDLTGFSEFDIPLMTRAKLDLIEMGLKPAERFAREWLSGYLPLPLQVCSAGQLYRAARRWAGMTGERFLPIQDQFTKAVKKTVELVARRYEDHRDLLRYKVVKLSDEGNGKRAERMWIPDGCAPPEGVFEGEWAAECVADFEKRLSAFCGGANEAT